MNRNFSLNFFFELSASTFSLSVYVLVKFEYLVIFLHTPLTIFVSIVVSIPACHAGDRGSIPRQRETFFTKTFDWEIFEIAEAIDWNPSKILARENIYIDG